MKRHDHIETAGKIQETACREIALRFDANQGYPVEE
jgi:hypothetical protein